MMPRVVLTPLKVNGEHVPSGYDSSFLARPSSSSSVFSPQLLLWMLLNLSGLTVFVILRTDTL